MGDSINHTFLAFSLFIYLALPFRARETTVHNRTGILKSRLQLIFNRLRGVTGAKKNPVFVIVHSRRVRVVVRANHKPRRRNNRLGVTETRVHWSRTNVETLTGVQNVIAAGQKVLVDEVFVVFGFAQDNVNLQVATVVVSRLSKVAELIHDLLVRHVRH